MKNICLLFLLAVLALPVCAADIKSGDDLIAAMHKKYDGKWYKTLTFVQKTTTIKADGTTDVATWFEALSMPGKLRIDIAPLESGNGMIFSDGSLHSFRGGKLAGSRPLVHPLLVLGFDVYHQSVDKTIAQLKTLNIDLSVVHEEKWQGKSVYVVGAKQDDVMSPQFWIDKKDLLFVRLIQPVGKDKKSIQETQFNKYQKADGGGWVSPEVLFFVDGKKTTIEEYSEIRSGMTLDTELWNPEKWMTVDREYYKKK